MRKHIVFPIICTRDTMSFLQLNLFHFFVFTNFECFFLVILIFIDSVISNRCFQHSQESKNTYFVNKSATWFHDKWYQAWTVPYGQNGFQMLLNNTSVPQCWRFQTIFLGELTQLILKCPLCSGYTYHDVSITVSLKHASFLAMWSNCLITIHWTKRRALDHWWQACKFHKPIYSGRCFSG